MHAQLLRHTKFVIAAIVVAGIALFVTAIGVGAFNGGNSAPSLPTAAQKQALHKEALGFAADGGDSHPGSMIVAAAHRKNYLALSGHTGSSDDASVFVVKMTGNFTYDQAPRPPGAPAPRGHLMVLTFDAQTLQLDDLEVGDHPVDLTQLGAVQDILTAG